MRVWPYAHSVSRLLILAVCKRSTYSLLGLCLCLLSSPSNEVRDLASLISEFLSHSPWCQVVIAAAVTIKNSRGALGAAQEKASRANPERNLGSLRPPSEAWGAVWVTSHCLSHLCGVWEGERALCLRPRPQSLWLPEHLCSSAPFLTLGYLLWLQSLTALLKVRGGADGTRGCPFPRLAAHTLPGIVLTK